MSWGVRAWCAAVVLGVGLPVAGIPAAASPDSGTALGAPSGEDLGTARGYPHGEVEFDDVAPAPPHARLTVPGDAAGIDGELRSSTRAKYRYAVSVVAIPVAGKQLGAGSNSMATMVDRVGRRMKDQTDGLVTYRFTSWTRAPRVKDKELPCDVERIYDRYQKYAKGLRTTPRGYTDTIALFVTPVRYRCNFAGSALLGGAGTYLNGLDLRDPQHLQDWITAHELGHNLTLVHAGSFHPTAPGWTITTDAVPQNERAQSVSEYGDYLDVMGSPPRGGMSLSGADFAEWTLDSVSQINLGVLDDRDVDIVEESGTVPLAALQPGGTPGGKSVLAIPVLADRADTYWLVEYRPVEQNAATVNYPPPWDTSGYGVRLILYEHASRRWYHINKVLRLERKPAGPAVLPIWQWVRLGGGARLGVAAQDAAAASISVVVPDSLPGSGTTTSAPWRG